MTARPAVQESGQTERPMHDPDLGVAVEGAGATEAEHLLPALARSRASRKPEDAFRRFWGRMTRESGSAGLHGLAEGLDVGVGQMSLGEGAPELAGEFVQGGSRAGAGGGFEELVGEHSSPFREPGQPRRSVQAKQPRCPSKGLAPNLNFEEDRACHSFDLPPLAGDTGPPSRRVFVFSGSRSSPNQRRISALKRGRRLAKAIRVNDSSCGPQGNRVKKLSTWGF